MRAIHSPHACQQKPMAHMARMGKNATFCISGLAPYDTSATITCDPYAPDPAMRCSMVRISQSKPRSVLKRRSARIIFAPPPVA